MELLNEVWLDDFMFLSKLMELYINKEWLCQLYLKTPKKKKEAWKNYLLYQVVVKIKKNNV